MVVISSGHTWLLDLSFLEDACMSGITRQIYTCNVLQLRLVRDFWVVPEQEVGTGRLVAASEAALRYRIPKTLVFFKHKSTAHNMRERRYAREGRKPILCYLSVSLCIR